MSIRFSYSRVSCYNACPYNYKLSYIDRLRTLPNYDAQNALYLGTVMHTGIEKDLDAALKQYFSFFPVINDLQVNEQIKFEYLIPLAKRLIPDGYDEVKIEADGFIGFIDRLVPKGGNHFAIYDYKYSNNMERYLQSGQLHIYKYYYELTHPGHVIDELFYVFIPKTMIRQKNSKKEKEDLHQFRERILATLSEKEIQIVKVDYDSQKVMDYLDAVEKIKAATEYPKKESRLCGFCDYKQYCTKGDTYMLLPKNERRAQGVKTKRVIWLYGQSFSGKTTLADKFPDPLFLNTDGNRNFTAPFLPIADRVEVNGRMTTTIKAWETLKEVVTELEKKQNTFKTIVIDLLDDVRRFCRSYVYDKLGIKHESDAGYGKGYDVVETEYLNMISRLENLNYEYIVFISHEDSSKSVTTKGGATITMIQPKIPEKMASKIAGGVTLIGRVVNDNGNRVLSFKHDEYVFGGDRLEMQLPHEIPLTFEAVEKLFNDSDKAKAEKAKTTNN